MKKVIRLTESDLTRIVKRVIRESKFRTQFGNMGYWIDEKGNWVDYDKDLENTGYYDFEYEPFTDVEDYEELPDDIKEKLFPDSKFGREFFNKYTQKHGRFRYSRMKDNLGEE